MIDKINPFLFRQKLYGPLILVLLSIITPGLQAQNRTDLTSLTAFKEAAPNWHIAGNVNADLNQDNLLTFTTGTGILVNQAVPGKHGEDLLFSTVHGDADLEIDFMMAKNSNSGIYLQGRYEVQLFDSWGKVAPASADVGGIYERWNDSKPDGQKGYEGHAPRQNAGHAPGLWQHLKISFQAPRFDATGKKSPMPKCSG